MTTDQTQGKAWPTDVERDAVAAVLLSDYGIEYDASRFTIQDFRPDAERVLAALAPHVARREREAAARALREWVAEMMADCRSGPQSAYTKAGLDLLRQALIRADRIERTQS